MKITVVSFDNWGFNKYLVQELNEQGHEATHIDFSKSKFKYKNFFYRIQNFISKNLQKKDLKRVFYAEFIENELKKLPKQDIVFYIKGDFIHPDCIPALKKYTSKSVAFFNDSADRCPKIRRVHHFFDQTFSFEKKDCEEMNMEFKTNFMYFKEQVFSSENKFEFKMFNVSSWDKRSDVVNGIANILSEKKYPFLFYIFSKKKPKAENFNKEIQFIQQKISLEEVDKYIDRAEMMLDINRDKQQGLTFRVFESLGKNKKLITTNTDIVNYTFYNSQNILVIDTQNISIPQSFLETNYLTVSSEVLYPYTLTGWVDTLIQSIKT